MLVTKIKDVSSHASPISRDTCSDCFRIVCKSCGWEPDNAQVILIKKEILSVCPECGWSPKEEILASKSI